MTVYEMIQKLSQYPADTEIKLASDWGEPVIEDAYLALADGPCICVTNTPESQEAISRALGGRAQVTDEMVARARAAFNDCDGNGETWGESADRAFRAALEAVVGVPTASV